MKKLSLILFMFLGTLAASLGATLFATFILWLLQIKFPFLYLLAIITLLNMAGIFLSRRKWAMVQMLFKGVK